MHNIYPAGRALQISRSYKRWKRLVTLLPWSFLKPGPAWETVVGEAICPPGWHSALGTLHSAPFCSVLLFSAQHWCLSTLWTLTSLLLLCLALVLFCPGDTLWLGDKRHQGPILTSWVLAVCSCVCSCMGSMLRWALGQPSKGEKVRTKTICSQEKISLVHPHMLFKVKWELELWYGEQR